MRGKGFVFLITNLRTITIPLSTHPIFAKLSMELLPSASITQSFGNFKLIYKGFVSVKVATPE